MHTPNTIQYTNKPATAAATVLKAILKYYWEKDEEGKEKRRLGPLSLLPQLWSFSFTFTEIHNNNESYTMRTEKIRVNTHTNTLGKIERKKTMKEANELEQQQQRTMRIRWNIHNAYIHCVSLYVSNNICTKTDTDTIDGITNPSTFASCFSSLMFVHTHALHRTHTTRHTNISNGSTHSHSFCSSSTTD